MRSLVLVVHDVPRILPRGPLSGSQVVRVDVTVQTGEDQRYMRSWYLDEIEARVVEVTPAVKLESW